MRRATLSIAIAAALTGGGVAHADTELSNERTITRWAHPWTTGAIHAEPKPSARTIGRLHFRTEDKMPEVYLALRSHTDDEGREWIKTRVLGRPNGRTGWVLREALGGFNTVRTQLTIDRGALTAVLRKRGRVIWRSRVGVGAPGTPTPAGDFYIREKLRGFGGAYGPWAFGTSAYSALSEWPGGGVVGIHGTNQPQLIPGRPSHGCIRVPNDKVRRLARLLPLGTPVRIR